MFPHYLFLFLKPPLKEQHLGGWWVKAWRPGSPMGFTQIAVPTGLYLEAMPWLVSTQFCLLCGAGDPTQGIARAVCVVTVQPCRRSASALGDAGALAPPAGRAVGPSILWGHPEGLLSNPCPGEGNVSWGLSTLRRLSTAVPQGQPHLPEQ